MELNVNVFEKFKKDWALVTAGNKDDFNTMLIAWGSLGTLWAKDVCTIFIRDSRYTLEYLDNNDYFTVSFYDNTYKKDMGYLGKVSGRDEDKVSKTSLNVCEVNHSVSFKEANMTIVCKKLYKQKLDINAMPQDVIDSKYPDGDMHNMIVGEVVEIIENN